MNYLEDKQKKKKKKRERERDLEKTVRKAKEMLH
jgi:hypothetical protein